MESVYTGPERLEAQIATQIIDMTSHMFSQSPHAE